MSATRPAPVDELKELSLGEDEECEYPSADGDDLGRSRRGIGEAVDHRRSRLPNGHSHTSSHCRRPTRSAQSSYTNSTQSSYTTTSQSSYGSSCASGFVNKQALDEVTGKLPKFKYRRVSLPSHLDSYQISDLLNPPRGIRDEMQRRGITPRDHHRDNRAKIAEKSAKNHANKQAAYNIPEVLATSCKDRKVQRPAPCREQKFECVDNGQENGEGPQPKTKTKDGIDYVTKNVLDAASAVRRSTKVERPSYRQKENFGKVPAYLLKRKVELAQDAERSIEGALLSGGPTEFGVLCSTLSPVTRRSKQAFATRAGADERLGEIGCSEDTRGHSAGKSKLEDRLRNMSLIVETPSQIRTKAELEYHLKDIENSVRRFSRLKVYIRYPET